MCVKRPKLRIFHLVCYKVSEASLHSTDDLIRLQTMCESAATKVLINCFLLKLNCEIAKIAMYLRYFNKSTESKLIQSKNDALSATKNYVRVKCSKMTRLS